MARGSCPGGRLGKEAGTAGDRGTQTRAQGHPFPGRRETAQEKSWLKRQALDGEEQGETRRGEIMQMENFFWCFVVFTENSHTINCTPNFP